MQQNIKDTKFESKSQLRHAGGDSTERCNRISKIQNLKANHNWLPTLVGETIDATEYQRYKI